MPAIDPGAAEAAIATAGDAALKRRYFTPFHMHASMGASAAVADFRPKPDPDSALRSACGRGSGA